MAITIATWNINSVRLRIGLIEKLIEEAAPDVICLQETKCPQGQFPSAPLKKLGYEHIAEFGQKGYHGVAIVSRIPFTEQYSRDFCNKGDCRHVSVRFDTKTKFALHNFYVPAGGEEPDIDINEKFDHKLKFVTEMAEWSKTEARPSGYEAIAVGDFNIAPLEHDVWGHKELTKVVSHTPIEIAHLDRVKQAGDWIDVMREHVPHDQKLYTWWSYRSKDWVTQNKGRRLDHIWASPGIARKVANIEVLKHTRGWTQTSDHVPVLAKINL